MRTATLVLVGYVLCIVVSSAWRMMPDTFGGTLVPDVIALTAAYLGLTARRYTAPAIGAAVILGYLGDLISGSPPGLIALVAGLVATIGDAVHRRILVRGLAMTFAFSVFVGAVASLLLIGIRGLHGMALADATTEITRVAGVALATGALGPAVLRLYRHIDAAFARTHRDRDATLEGFHT